MLEFFMLVWLASVLHLPSAAVRRLQCLSWYQPGISVLQYCFHSTLKTARCCDSVVRAINVSYMELSGSCHIEHSTPCKKVTLVVELE